MKKEHKHKKNYNERRIFKDKNYKLGKINKMVEECWWKIRQDKNNNYFFMEEIIKYSTTFLQKNNIVQHE